MNARPILMHGRSIRALFDGRKTQTRRVVKPRRAGGVVTGPAADPGGAIEAWGGGAWHTPSQMEVQPSPYGQPGDLLWVREPWRSFASFDTRKPKKLELATQAVRYEADGDVPAPPGESWGKYRHARFMPRGLSRLTLRLTDVRVERVQEIGQGSACREGRPPGVEPISWFADLWESLHGAGAWARNDWVWVLCFEVLHENVDAVLAREAA